MDRHTLNLASKKIADLLKTTHKELSQISNNGDLVQTAKRRMIAEKRSTIVDQIYGAVKEYLDTYQQLSIQTQKQFESESSAYKPAVSSDKQTFLLQKLIMQNELQNMNEKQLLDLWEKPRSMSNEDDQIQQRILEELLPGHLRRNKSARAKIVDQQIQDAQSSRVNGKTKETLETLEHQKSLYNFSTRFIGNLANHVVTGSDVHMWGGLSKDDELKGMSGDFQRFFNL